jgi:hypothetical protein
VVLAAIQWLFAPPFGVGLALAAGASVLVVIVNRRLLDVANTFPEVLRVPGARRFLGS